MPRMLNFGRITRCMQIFRNSVRSDFAMTITPMQFFQMNYWTIVGGVKNRYGTPLDPLPS
jgi:hypothetical protein